MGQDRRGDGPSDVLLVVEDDGAEYDHGQIADPGPPVGVVVELPVPQPSYAGARGPRPVVGDRHEPNVMRHAPPYSSLP